MTGVFIFFAAVGGTVLLFQLAMTLMGFGAEGLEADASDVMDGVDIGDVAGATDVDVDVDTDTVFDDSDHADTTHGFKVLSFRTIVAFVTFFGLGGLIAEAAGQNPLVQLLVAIGFGAAAMYGVYKIYATLYAMQHEGTAKVDNAVGCYGSVYVPIPANEAGQGKALINVQQRTMEYQAVTPGEMLPSGTRIVVTRVVTANTVEVVPAIEKEEEAAE